MINIHHSFLPSFKGAKPYHQAHQRGVKLIGATAHLVTSDLDEGNIIQQGEQTRARPAFPPLLGCSWIAGADIIPLPPPPARTDVERVSHSDSPSDLVKKGSEIETRVLARAVTWFAEHRVLVNGNKTVVFD